MQAQRPGSSEPPTFRDDPLTSAVIEAAIRVHSRLGPGFMENIYRRSMVIELQKAGHVVEAEKELPVLYEGELVGTHRLDLFVDGRLILELKTVERIDKVHYGQLPSYLRAANQPIGLLINFAGAKADFRRVENPVPCS